MGLDMFLTKHIFIGAEYGGVTGKIELARDGEPFNIDISKVSTVVESVAYWRKANAIHNWFVQTLANGEDNCQPIYCTIDDLKKLLGICEKIMAVPTEELRSELAAKLLPPCEGFFFGSTKIDEYYWEDLKYTIEILKGAVASHDKHVHYEYCASW